MRQRKILDVVFGLLLFVWVGLLGDLMFTTIAKAGVKKAFCLAGAVLCPANPTCPTCSGAGVPSFCQNGGTLTCTTTKGCASAKCTCSTFSC